MLALIEDISRDERRAVFAALTTLFALMSGHLLVETARDAVFLANLPAEQLPVLYIVIAVLSMVATRIQRGLSEFVSDHHLLIGWLVISAVLNLLLWLFLEPMGDTGIYVLYVVPGVVLTVALIQFWVLLGGTLTMGDAKRMYVLIGAGGGLGAIAGSGAATGIASLTDPEHMLLAAAGVFLLTPLAVLWMRRSLPDELSKDRPERELGGWESLKSLLEKPYTGRIALFALLIPMAATIADYLFKSMAADHIEAASLGSFIGLVYLGLNLFSLIIQVGAVRRTIRRFSIAGALAALPILLSLGGVAIIFGFAFIGAVGLKIVDGSLRHSLHDTAEELLYVPLSKTERSRLKALTAVVCKRGGQALASLALIGIVTMEAESLTLGILLTVLTAAAAATALNLKRHYVELFRTRLNDASLEYIFDYPDLDVDSLERLIGHLSSQEDAEVIAAIDLLEAEGRTRSIPALILYHPSRDVVLRALSAYVEEGVSAVIPVLERVDRDAEASMHAALLSAHASLDPDEDWLTRHLQSDDEVVRSIATFHLVARGWRDRSAVDIDVSKVLEEGTPAQKRAMVFAIGTARATDFIHELVLMLDDDSLGVRKEAVRAMKAIGEESCKEALRWRLSDRQIRDDLIDAFKSLGEEGFVYLVDSLDDESLPRRVRWQIPRAIGRFGRIDSAIPMARRLPEERDGKVRARIVDEIERLRLVDASIELPAEPLKASIEWNIERAYRLVHWRIQLEDNLATSSSEAAELLSQMLRDKEEHTTDIILRISGFLSSSDDLRRARRGLEIGDDVERASAIELLEFNLPHEYREAVLGLVDDRDDSVRLNAGSDFFDADAMELGELLEQLLESQSDMLAMLVAAVAVDMGSTDTTEALSRAKQWADPELTDSLDAAISNLRSHRQAQADGAPHA